MMVSFIPSAYATMIPAAALLGLSEATIWPSMVFMNHYFGTEYSKLRKRPEMSQYYVNVFSGSFFTVHHLNQVIQCIVGSNGAETEYSRGQRLMWQNRLGVKTQSYI